MLSFPQRNDYDITGADPIAMGERIREARRALNIMTPVLTRKYGLTASLISYTERGVNGPSYRLLYAMAQFGVSPLWVSPGKRRAAIP